MVAVGLAQAGLWWRAAAWYPRLPDRFPIHFDLAGNPDGWATKSAGAWFLLPALASLLTASLAALGLFGIPALARRAPGLINIPAKDRFLTLDAARRVEAVGPVGTFLLFEGVLMGGLFLWVVEISGRVATGLSAAAKPWPVAIVLVGTTIGVPLMLVGLMRSVERAATKGVIPPQSRSDSR